MCPSEFDIGYLIGLLVGEGHFGGDGRQPHITLRMHTDHEPIFRWLERTFPGGRIYGPYHHSGRSYFQWMARGPFLRDVLVPLLERHLTADLDLRTWSRFQAMKERYPSLLAPASRPATGDTPPASPDLPKAAASGVHSDSSRATSRPPSDRRSPRAPRPSRSG